MRLLFCTPDFPAPPTKGTALRNEALLRHLARRHEVHLLSFDSPEADVPALEEHGVRVETVPLPQPRGRWLRLRGLRSPLPDLAQRRLSPAFATRLAARLDEPWDVVQFEGLEMAPYLQQALERRRGPRPCLVLDAHNAEYRLQQRALAVDRAQPPRWLAALWSLLQLGRLRRYETAALRWADAVVAVSGEDRTALLELAPDAEIAVVPNGIDVSSYEMQREPEVPPVLLYTGSFDYRPNIDAAQWFVGNILALVRREIIDARLWLVGRDPVPAVLHLAAESVVVTGAVPDDRPYFARASVYVVPTRIGAGLRFKVLQAMAASVPMVSTSLGMEGVPAEAGRHYLPADDAGSFAQAIVRVLREPSLGERLATAARELVAAFDWSVLVPKLDSLYERLALAGTKSTMRHS